MRRVRRVHYGRRHAGCPTRRVSILFQMFSPVTRRRGEPYNSTCGVSVGLRRSRVVAHAGGEATTELGTDRE